MLTTYLRLFLLMFNMLLLYLYYFFTTCLLLVTMLLLLIYYMITTCYYMFTTSLLHVCYCLLVLLHVTMFVIRCYYFLLLFTMLYHVLLFLYMFVYGQTPPLVLVPSSHYYLSSLSWTSRTFYFPDSRYLLEVLRGLPWQRERDP